MSDAKRIDDIFCYEFFHSTTHTVIIISGVARMDSAPPSRNNFFQNGLN